jgi:hypothetical protein
MSYDLQRQLDVTWMCTRMVRDDLIDYVVAQLGQPDGAWDNDHFRRGSQFECRSAVLYAAVEAVCGCPKNRIRASCWIRVGMIFFGQVFGAIRK